MCFIKVGDPLSPCDHEECKRALEAFQTSNCIYNHPSQSQMLPNNQTLLNLNLKRPRSPQPNLDISQDVLKKMKFNKEEMQFRAENSENTNNALSSSMGFQIQAAQPLNYIFQAPIPQTPYILNPLFQQKPQPAQMYQNYGNNSYNEAMLNLQFRMKCNPGNMMQAQENKSSKIAEMDKQIWSTLINQNTLLTEMKEKTNALGSFMERMAQDFSELQKTVNILKTEKKNEVKTKKETELQCMDNSSVSNTRYFVNSSEISKADELLQYLYLEKPKNFQYQLLEGQAIELPLYRERNFMFSIILKDMNGNEVFHTNRIPVSIAIYTYENPPKCIDSNTSGNKILKGYAEKDLVNGTCSFEKIQIKEVTSHFRKGKIFIVIYPKMSTFGNIPQENSLNSLIDYTTIKPLIIENVVVKAKKLPTFFKKIKQQKKESSQFFSDKNSIFEDI